MTVYCNRHPGNIRRAYMRPYQDGRPAHFRADPPAENKLENERAFETEDDLAYFLLRNPNWKALVKGPNDQIGNHINRTIQIEGVVDLDRLRRTERV